MCADQEPGHVLACMNRYCNLAENSATRMCTRLRRREFNFTH